MNAASLIVEGGGMRGFFAAGILAELLDAGIRLPYVVGVSSGALCAAAYAGGRIEPDFSALGESPLGFLRPAGLVRPTTGIVRTGALIDALCAGAWERLAGSGTRLRVCATDAETAEAVWWDNGELAASEPAMRERLVASASIPFVMPRATVDGRVFADGGIVDSIPLDKAEADGFRRHVMILTRPRGYVKPRQHLELYLRHVLRPYPLLKHAMLTRHIRYNEAVRAAEAKEDEGAAFVFRMDRVDLGRFEYSPAKLRRAFDDGRAAACARIPDLMGWLDGASSR